MRLKSVVAEDAARALARLRAVLGEDAIIVATQELKGGGVRVTAAVESADLDLADLLQPAAGSAAAPWLTALAEHHDIPDPLRTRLVHAARGLMAGEPATVLSHVLHGLFQFAPLPTSSPVPYLLVGPPGAGKTASLAKLAARAVLARGKVAVMTTDVGRAGGIGQLEALTGPLGLEVASAPDGATLRRLVGAAEVDLVLIDSPGLNPFKPADLGKVSALIEASGAEAILVLPAGLATLDCADIAHTYAALGVKRLLATKLDAARRLGGLLAAADAGLAFAEAGIGPTIGRGLSPLGAAGLARLLLHTQKASTATPLPGGSNAHG